MEEVDDKPKKNGEPQVKLCTGGRKVDLVKLASLLVRFNGSVCKRNDFVLLIYITLLKLVTSLSLEGKVQVFRLCTWSVFFESLK